MICINCNNDRKESDFINKNKLCYRCVYQIKADNPIKLPVQKPKICRMCEKEIPAKDPNGKQRTVFCSEACAVKGNRWHSDHQWFRAIRPCG